MNLANGLTGSTDLEDNVTCDATAVLLKKGNVIICSVKHCPHIQMNINMKQLGQHSSSIFVQLQDKTVQDDFIKFCPFGLNAKAEHMLRPRPKTSP